MEVHHHSHTARKKWAHYFWEFLMLFLAVTLGFFVENQREHYVENMRAKQYASFLHGDLVKDTANLTGRILFMNKGIQEMDTLIQILKSPVRENLVDKIYALSTYPYSNPVFTASTSTIDQLKSSGSLRYFHNTELIRNFSDYDNEIRNMKTVEDRNAYIMEETRKFLTQFMDLKGIPLPVIFETDTTRRSQQFFAPITQKLYKKDPAQFEQYANLCALKQIDWMNKVRLMNRTLRSARNLILSLKEGYHLE